MEYSKLKLRIISLMVLCILLGILNHDWLFYKTLKRSHTFENFLQEKLIMPEKFWLHRMNNLNSFRNEALLKGYKGIEMDVIYYEKINLMLIMMCKVSYKIQ